MYLVRSREMRALDAKAVEMGIPAAILMENAGRAVADEVERLLPLKGTVAVLAGPGQNGGDGLCAARHLAARGFPVRVLLLGNLAKMPREARDNLAMLENYTVDLIEVADQNLALREALARMADARVVIDALLGTGQAGDARPPMDEAVRWANEAGAPIIACDIPTGVDADTGSVFNPVINATVTVTMGLQSRAVCLSRCGACGAGLLWSLWDCRPSSCPDLSTCCCTASRMLEASCLPEVKTTIRDSRATCW